MVILKGPVSRCIQQCTKHASGAGMVYVDTKFCNKCAPWLLCLLSDSRRLGVFHGTVLVTLKNFFFKHVLVILNCCDTLWQFLFILLYCMLISVCSTCHTSSLLYIVIQWSFSGLLSLYIIITKINYKTTNIQWSVGMVVDVISGWDSKVSSQWWVYT